jgi:hypothetical protein
MEEKSKERKGKRRFLIREKEEIFDSLLLITQ